MTGAHIPRLPALVDVPPDAPRDTCLACGVALYAVGRQPITCEPVFRYKGTETDMRPHGVAHPTATTPGRGWNHFADCPERDKFRRRPAGPGGHASAAPTPAEREAAATPETPPTLERGVIPSDAHEAEDPAMLAEVVWQRSACKAAGIECSDPTCDRPSVVIVSAASGDKLAAFPCEQHADAFVDAMQAAGHVVRAEAPTKYLANAAHPEWRPALIRRAADVRRYFATHGITFPPASHGSRRGL